ncbi:MAG: PilN domain-containing protein [Acidobacteria bacterium]|nr:PilN domain-containing protein [Acidobacteriota bacterium]
MMLDFNYSTRPFVDPKKYYYLLGALLLIAVIFTFINISGYLGYVSQREELSPQTSFLEDKKEKLIKESENLKNEISKFDRSKITANADVINAMIDMRMFSWTGLLNDLEKVIPDNVIVKSINPITEKNEVRIKIGIKTREYEGILAFIKNLNKSKVFTEIMPMSESQVKDKGATEIESDFSVKYTAHKSEKKEEALNE